MRLAFQRTGVHFLVLACAIPALCLIAGCSKDSPQSAKKEGYNLLRPDRSNTTPTRRDIQRPASNERIERLAKELQKEFSPSVEQTSRDFLYFGTFLAGVVLISVALVYWQLWKRNRAEWELNDPMALLKELNYVHQLSDAEKRFMQELSELNTLPTPLKLFVEPKFLLEAWENDTHVTARSSVRRLLSKLFDITVEEENLTAVLAVDGKNWTGE